MKLNKELHDAFVRETVNSMNTIYRGIAEFNVLVSGDVLCTCKLCDFKLTVTASSMVMKDGSTDISLSALSDAVSDMQKHHKEVTHKLK